MMEYLINRAKFEGCLVGLAVGDALGMPFEGLRASAIRAQFGSVRDFIDAPWRMLKGGQWTDDTKMMISQARSILDEGRFEASDTAAKFIEWLRSNDWRGIGGATYSSLKRLEEGVDPGQSGEDGELAAGNGVAMRIAPLGLLDCLDLEKLREDVRETGNITHRNREAIAGAQAVAYAIARGVRGDLEPETLIADAVGFIGPCLVADRLGQASRFLASEMDSAEALARLGTGGYVVETVASAFFCFLSSPDDFEEAVSLAVAGGLDTDTMGAITGAISGACNGLEGVPERWRERVESYRDIVTMADGIYDIVLHGSQSK